MSAAIGKDSEDHALLLAIQQGNHSAFNILVDRHHQMFYRVAYRYLNSREEAEDIVQNSFLKLWERPDIWDGSRKNKFTTWFYRIVVNLCLDKKKKKKPLALADDYDAPDDRLSQLEQMEDAEKRSAVNTSIQQLPDRQKQALILCFYEGLSNKEASEIMGMRTRALQSLLIRAKDNLKKSLRIGKYDG